MRNNILFTVRTKILKQFSLATVVASVSLANPLQAQDVSALFADDFSTDSIRYSAFSFSEGPSSGSAQVENGQLILRARKSAEADFGNIFVSTTEDTDTLMVTAAFNTATNLSSGSGEELAIIAVEERIYNTLADGGLNDGSSVGDVQVRFDVRLRGDGSGEHFFCLGEQTLDSFEPLNVFDNNSNSCSFFEGVTIQQDVEYTFGYSLDRTTNSLTLTLDDNSQTVTLPGTLFRAVNPFTGFQLIHEGGPGLAEARVRSIVTDSGTDVINAASSIGRYQPFNTSAQRSVSLINQAVWLSAEATEEDNSSIQLRIAQPTDYLEAEITISSDTALGERGRHFTELRANLYNDTTDGGFNEFEGEVSAFLTFQNYVGDQRMMEYCLWRSDDAEGNERTGLLDGGRRCATVPIKLELDTPYRSSIQLDREQAAIIFRVDGFTHTQPIATGIFDASRKLSQIGTSPNNLASVFVIIDNVRTAPDAITAGEQSAGQSTPVPFPAPLDAESLIAASTLTIPVFDQDQSLEFIDDFSSPSMRYGFWDGREQGQVGIARSSEGHIEFQVNSDDLENGNFAEFYLDGPTDLVEARVSLTSQIDLPVDSEAEATVRVQGTFYNDTTDGGVDQQAGDVFVSLQIRVRGDGRRDVDLYMERRAADGSRDVRLDLVPDGSNVFEGFAPNLDTEYMMTLSLDRANRQLIASINDLVQEVNLPTDVFTAARSDKQIQVSHRGASGRAVGRIHAIRTDVSAVDFFTDNPVIGPYRPLFAAGYPGIETVHEDGRVRMVADSSITPGRGADLQGRGASDFVGATMLMSSDTTTGISGSASVGIGGLFYNELADGGTDGATGSVFAFMAITMDSSESGTSELFVEYCAIRSDDADFNATTELIQGDPENCPRFSMPGLTDVSYEMSIELDQTREVLIYRLGDEIQEYQITTQIFDPHSRFNGARVRADEGARAIGYADNLSYSANAVPLADSANLLGGNVSTPLPTSSSGGGGGCSIHSNGTEPLIPAMALLSMWVIWRRSRNQGLNQ